MNRRSPWLILWLVLLCAAVPPKAQARPRWVMPRPPIPVEALRQGESGTVKLKVTTDATGKVVRAVASVPARQKDIPNLARGAVQWALAHWSGPPNTVAQTEMKFITH